MPRISLEFNGPKGWELWGEYDSVEKATERLIEESRYLDNEDRITGWRLIVQK